MANIGSVFLGDVQRHRVFSTSTPPNSPPANPVYSGAPSSPPLAQTSGLQPIHDDDIEGGSGEEQPKMMSSAKTNPIPVRTKDDGTSQPKAVTIDPVLAMELRLRWIEALVLGVPDNTVQAPRNLPSSSHRKSGPGSAAPLRNTKRNVSGAESKAMLSLKHGETLVRLSKELQSRLDEIVEANEGLKRFMTQYDQHAHLLTPASALSGILAEARPGAAAASAAALDYANMSPEEFDALLQEMESDIRSADRDMREIEMLESKGVTGAGKLADYEQLKPRLEALIKVRQENLGLVASLEERIASLIRSNATQVDALSELFVAWDDTLTEAENKVSRLERERAERLRLGLEQDTY